MRFSSLITVLALFCLLVTSSGARAVQMDLPHINVLADPSLSVAISALSRLYAKEKGVSVTASYASARDQADNISAGLEADVFITARTSMLDTLKGQGLVDVYSQKAITRNRLSMATYAENTLQMILIPKLPLTDILKRIDPGFSFVIGDPNFQNAGFYAMRALRNYEMADELEPYLLVVRSPVDVHRTIAQPGGYGVMYLSEAKRNNRLKILGTFPEVAHQPIIYYGVVVAGENMTHARDFLTFLQSEAAQRVFVQQGFESMQRFIEDNGHLARGSTSSGSYKPL